MSPSGADFIMKIIKEIIRQSNLPDDFLNYFRLIVLHARFT
jgi:hypothetical protein